MPSEKIAVGANKQQMGQKQAGHDEFRKMCPLCSVIRRNGKIHRLD